MSFDTTEQQLSAVLAEIGQVKRVHIGTDRETGRSRGFAFAEFASDAEAAAAIRRFDGFDLGGRRLRVNNAEDRPPRPVGGGRPAPAPPSSLGSREAFGAPDPFSFDMGAGGRSSRGKGSRRGLRARKRSLSY